MSKASEKPNTPLGKKFPYAADCCHDGCMPLGDAGLFWPVGVVYTTDTHVRFRYLCERGHKWECSWALDFAAGGFGAYEEEI